MQTRKDNAALPDPDWGGANAVSFESEEEYAGGWSWADAYATAGPFGRAIIESFGPGGPLAGSTRTLFGGGSRELGEGGEEYTGREGPWSPGYAKPPATTTEQTNGAVADVQRAETVIKMLTEALEQAQARIDELEAERNKTPPVKRQQARQKSPRAAKQRRSPAVDELETGRSETADDATAGKPELDQASSVAAGKVSPWASGGEQPKVTERQKMNARYLIAAVDVLGGDRWGKEPLPVQAFVKGCFDKLQEGIEKITDAEIEDDPAAAYVRAARRVFDPGLWPGDPRMRDFVEARFRELLKVVDNITDDEIEGRSAS